MTDRPEVWVKVNPAPHKNTVMIGPLDISDLVVRAAIYVEADGRSMVSLTLPLDKLDATGAAVLDAPTKSLLHRLGWVKASDG